MIEVPSGVHIFATFEMYLTIYSYPTVKGIKVELCDIMLENSDAKKHNFNLI